MCDKKAEGQTNSTCFVTSIDHFVITVADVDKTVEFYTRTLGMKLVKFGQGRLALEFGNQKINIHKAGSEFKPHADKPTSGSADLCFVSNQSLEEWQKYLKSINENIIEGPVPRTGAIGPMNSIYLRDPDSNLIEIAYYGKSSKD